MHQAQIKNQPSQPSQRLPMAMRVANAMQKIGVAGLPRNYEIFYAAISGTNEELQQELMESGTNIDQQMLNQMHSKYFTRADDEALVHRLCSAIEDQVSASIATLEREKTAVSNFGNILEQGAAKLDPKLRMPPEVVNKIAGLLSKATETAKHQGQQALREMEDGSTQLNKMKTELAEYKRLSNTDALTGIYNRRAFDDKLGEIDDRAMKNSTIIVGDIDKFKAINDTYGHPFGDVVIKAIAGVVQSNTREDVFCARIGGEEFAMISLSIDEEGMMRLAERERIAVSETSFSDGRTQLSPGKITISFGVCHGSQAADTSALYAQADEALYASKRISRNRVTLYSQLANSPDRKNLFLYRD